MKYKKGNISWNKGKRGLQVGYYKGKKLSEAHRQKLSTSHVGHTVSEETKKKISKTTKGKSRPWLIGREVSIETRKKLSIASKGNKYGLGTKRTPEQRLKLKNRISKEKHWNWKGGITPENNILRHSVEYKIWRIAVFTRDNFTCIWCGKRGITLNADHIQEWAKRPDLRFAIDNGRTLCAPCHKIRTWGWKI